LKGGPFKKIKSRNSFEDSSYRQSISQLKKKGALIEKKILSLLITKFSTLKSYHFFFSGVFLS